MNRTVVGAALVAASFLLGPQARAGIYTDDLTRCLVRSTSATDQSNLIIWVFASMSGHPDAAPYVNISSAEHDARNKTAALTVQRLVTEDCRAETVAAIKYEGPKSMETAFSTLGEVAMRGMMSHPNVAKGIQSLDSYIDVSKFESLAKDAGYPAPKAR